MKEEKQESIVSSVRKKRKCYNCKYRTKAFKVGKLTHYHCMRYTEDTSPWGTLRVFSDSCNGHEFR